MRPFLILFFCLLTSLSSLRLVAQTPQSIWTAEFVKSKPDKLDSAAAAYNMNWGEARAYAKKLKFISSYQLLKVDSSFEDVASGKPTDSFDIILLTEYPNNKAYQDREKNFQIVFDKYQPGWNLLHGKKPAYYADRAFYMVYKTPPVFLKAK